MRKIKVNKKDVERKQKKVSKLVEELLHHHLVTHDVQKMLDAAQQIYELRPDDPESVERIASIYIDYKFTDKAALAVDYLEKRFEKTPYRLFLRSRVCDLQADYGGCIKYSEDALKMNNVPMLVRMMAHNILGHAYRYAGDAINSIKHYELSGKMDLSKMPPSDDKNQCIEIQREDICNYFFSLHNINLSREKLFEEIQGYEKKFGNVKQFTHSPETHPRHKKIRIGYISPDIRRHVVAFFSYAFFKSYDKSRFEVYIYARNREDKFTDEFKAGADHFRNILFDTPQEAAQKIKNDEIDILIDLSGHTANNCLRFMVYKPAPIQISGIGWFNTTGLKTIDYFIADKYTDPVGMNEKYFTEKLLRLQHSHFCYMWHDNPSVINPAPCTKNGYITFVSFNNFTKVTDETLRVWAKIVNAVPKSKLYLKGKAFRDEYGTSHALARIKAAGLSLDRLIYEPDSQEYLHKYAETDIALDTFPYPGGGTTCDALYMGVPVVTYVSTERHNTRFGYSLLKNVGLEELCAFTEEDYIKIAVDLANDWDRVREYHLTIRRKMEVSPIMNDAIYMGEMEQAYEKIYNSWISGAGLPDFPQDPEPITAELAENYYYRACGYIKAEKQNPSERMELSVNIKRALFYFELAAQADKKHDAEIYLSMAACKYELLDYVGAYQAICKCGEIIYSYADYLERFSNKFLSQYHEEHAKLALLNGDPVEAAENYDMATRYADDDTKFELASSAFFSLNFLDMSSEDTAAPHFEYQNLLKDIKPYTTYHERKDKIKIGYLSADFRQHAMFAIIFGMIVGHNKNKFDVTCYSLNEKDDIYTNIFKQHVKKFISVKDLSYFELAEKIHNDEIDVLVDLSGHSAGNVLPALAYKPAPIQISGLGYMATTGMKAMDYFITDEIVDPPGEHEKYFSEKLLYLPSQFSYATRSDVQAPTGAPCMKNGFVTFGSICRYQKISNEMLMVWKEILNRVPNSVLMMRAQEFASISTMDNAYNRMKAIGFNMDQVTFLPAVFDYLNSLLKLDLILDTYPYVGGSTTLDAIYMGVPVLTFYGERRSTRFGLSILKNIGLEGLAVDNVADYINRAVGLANDKNMLDALHKNLRTMLAKSRGLNSAYYCEAFENQIEKILRE